MSVEKDAVVRFRAEGDDEVARAAGRVESAWSGAGKTIAGAFSSAGSAIKGAVSGVLSDIGHVVTAAGAINFAGSVQQVQRFEDQVARLGIGANRSIQSVQASVNALGRDIGVMPDATAAWISSVGQLTYSYEGAASSAKGLAEYAALTGQSLDQVQGLAVALGQVAGASANAERFIGTIVRQTNELGTAGGPKAVGDMFQRLQGQLSQLSSSDSMAKTTALLSGFGGKGFTPQQRERALSSVISKIESNPEGFERFLGHKIVDEQGHIKNISGVMKELADIGRKSDYAKMRTRFTFGAEGAAALLNTDFDAIERASKLEPTTSPQEALSRLKETPAGKKTDAEIRKFQAMQKTVGEGSLVGDMMAWIREKSADNPLAAGAGIAVGSKLIGPAAGAIGKGVMSFLGFGGGTAAAGGGAATAGGGGVSLAAGGSASAAAAGGVVLAGVAAQLKVLSELGAASKLQQGFIAKALGANDADELAARAKAAEADAGKNMSPGMKAAMAAEKARLDARRADQNKTEIGEKQDPTMQKFGALVDQMVKAGADLKLAQETAAKLLAQGQGKVQIEIVDATGRGVDAQVRGEQ